MITNLAVFIAFIAYFNITGNDGSRMRGRRAAAAARAGAGDRLFSLAGIRSSPASSPNVLFQAGWNAAVARDHRRGRGLVSLYYYLMVMKQMYMYEPARKGRIYVPVLLSGVVVVLVVAVVALGIYPTPLLEAADNAGKLIF
jgi:hypothetical protein